MPVKEPTEKHQKGVLAIEYHFGSETEGLVDGRVVYPL